MALAVVINGGVHEDARGRLRFCNDFDMSAVKRFYTIVNSAERPVRGWVGHKRETKWFFPLKGETIIEIEPMADIGAEPQGYRAEFILNAGEPMVLKVEPGNWFCIRQDGNAEVMVFSDCNVGELENDDLRRSL